MAQQARWSATLASAIALTTTGAASAQPVACIAAGTPPEQVAARIAAAARALPQAANVAERWTLTASDGGGLLRGEPVTLTWSVVPDGTVIQPALLSVPESSDPSNLEAYLGTHHGTREQWVGLIQDALDGWSAGPGIRFVHEPNDDGVDLNSQPGVLGVRGDIRFGGHDIDGNLDTAAYAFFPGGGGDVVIDTNDSFNTAPQRLQNVVAHEAGHAIGLGHVCPLDMTKLMEPVIAEIFSGPQFDDLLGAHRNYGDVEEENDTAVEAAPVGFGVDTTSDITNLALDGPDDEDWFVVPPGTPSEVSIVLDPGGTPYPFGATSGGLCDGVAIGTLDPRTIQDLNLEIYDFDGSRLLASADATATGGSESISNLQLSSLGGFIKVGGIGSNDAQAYEIGVTRVPEPTRMAMRVAAIATLAGLALRRHGRGPTR